MGRITQPDECGLSSEFFKERRIHRALDEDARSAHAGLPCGDEGCERRAIDRAIHIYIVEDNDGALAATREGSRREIAAGRLTDRAANIGAAGEDDFSDFRMRGERRTRHGAHTIDEIDDSLGYPRAIQ